MNWFPRLVVAYAEGERHYHSIEHPASMVRRYLEMVHKRKLAYDHAVFLAIWWHDAVYDATQKDNETASAYLMSRICVDEESAHITEAFRHILCTAHHKPADDASAVLCDLDLFELSGEWNLYIYNATMVRREFSHLTNVQWVHGRSGWLMRMIDRPQLFHSFAHTDELENKAKQNLEGELGLLDSGGFPYNRV